jgi:hypothetical protein
MNRWFWTRVRAAAEFLQNLSGGAYGFPAGRD